MGKIAISELERIPGFSKRTMSSLVDDLKIPIVKQQKGNQYISVIDEKHLIDIILYIYTTRNMRILSSNDIDIANKKEISTLLSKEGNSKFISALEEHILWHSKKLEEIKKVIKEGNTDKYLDILSSLIKGSEGVSQEKVIVVDTSVLHKKPTILDELVNQFSRVIIPDVVIRELNYQKDSKNPKLDKKKISIILGSIRKYKDKLILSDYRSQERVYNNDDLIIEVAKNEISENVYILTEDGDFEIKCKDLLNITVLSLEGYELEFNTKDNKIDYVKTMKFIKSVKNKDYNTVKSMNLENIDINSCGDDGQTALITAVRNRDIKMINILIDHCKVDVNALDKNKYCIPALTHAIMINRFDIVKLLVKKGADINLGGQGVNRGNTPLMIASWNGNLQLVEFLLKQEGICVNQQDSNGFTPLIKAAIRNRVEVAEILLKNGADKQIRSFEDKTAADYARDSIKSKPAGNRDKSLDKIISLFNS